MGVSFLRPIYAPVCNRAREAYFFVLITELYTALKSLVSTACPSSFHRGALSR